VRSAENHSCNCRRSSKEMHLTSLHPLAHETSARPAVINGAPTGGNTQHQTIAIVGLGYVGLPTALAFADAAPGTDVIGIDIDADRLQQIERGHVDLIPADIARLDRVLASNSIELTDDSAALQRADAVIICVPTPVDKHLTPDLRALKSACEAAVYNARVGQTLVLTSTSYIGTTDDLLITPLNSRGLTVGRDVFVAFSPERIDPGNTTMTQDMVPRVIGGATAECVRRASALIERIAPTVHAVSSPAAAEFSKLFENTYRAVNITLVNEMADVARRFDLDIMEVVDAAATKPYGFSAFYPGPGIGGHCIPCDPHYLLWHLRGERGTAPLVETAMSRSAARPGQVVTRAVEVLADEGKSLRGARVAVIGVTYKPDVQDVRESPALEILAELIECGARVQFHDMRIPEIELQNGVRLRSQPLEAIQGCDLAIAHTLHADTDLAWMATLPAVLDTTYRLQALPNRHTL
jgi:UDP-N-acetyl-D-glucosamine dehydrogenase